MTATSTPYPFSQVPFSSCFQGVRSPVSAQPSAGERGAQSPHRVPAAGRTDSWSRDREASASLTGTQPGHDAQSAFLARRPLHTPLRPCSTQDSLTTPLPLCSPAGLTFTRLLEPGLVSDGALAPDKGVQRVGEECETVLKGWAAGSPSPPQGRGSGKKEGAGAAGAVVQHNVSTGAWGG